jgi:hypothetical protein
MASRGNFPVRANPESTEENLRFEDFMDKEMDKCESQCGEHKCLLPLRHKGKHREQGNSWTDAGAARVNAELEIATE